MKTKLLLFSMMILCSMVTFSQSYYYYYKGNKIPLAKDDSKVTVISLKGKSPKNIVSKNTGLQQAEIINDAKYEIRVLELASSNMRTTTALMSATSVINDNNAIILPTYKNTEGANIRMTNYLNVKLKNENDKNLLQSVANKYSLEIVAQNKFMPLWYTLSITPESKANTLDIANSIYETGLFTASVPDFVSDDQYCSYDTRIGEQWGLYNSTNIGIDISICQAWNYSTGRGVKIGVLDSGVDVNHTDFSGNIYNTGYDTESGTSPCKVFSRHGSHCAGIAAAKRNNGFGTAGVAPDAKIIPISNSLASSSLSRIKRGDGINWAWKNGADIITNSWGSGTYHEEIDDAIDNAIIYGRNGKGCIIVFASGNDYSSSVSYPANYRDEIIAVGAISNNGNRSDFSNYGNALDVVAPGVNILSTVPNNAHEFISGTSMACPHVAGIAALILERNPGLTVKQVNNIIEKSTKKVGPMSYNANKANGTWNVQYGYGLVNAYNAVINTPRAY